MDLATISHLPGPALLWRGADHDSLDLTGPVIANWVHKGVGLFSDYDLGPDFTLFAPLPEGLHWRELVAVLSVLFAGGRVVARAGTADPDAAGSAAAPDEAHFTLVPLGHESAPLTADAEEVFVFNPPALALSTPVDADCIDVNSAIRSYPDVASRRLEATGVLEIDGQLIDWTQAPQPAGAGRAQGLLVSHSTPRPSEWPQFLGHLLGGGQVLLATGIDPARITDLESPLGEVRGRLGLWTK